MHLIKGHIPFGRLHQDIFARRDSTGIDRDIFGLHRNAAACGDSIIEVMDLLLTFNIPAHAGGNVDAAFFSTQDNILTRSHGRAIVVNGAVGAYRRNGAACFDAAVHAVADVIDVAF